MIDSDFVEVSSKEVLLLLEALIFEIENLRKENEILRNSQEYTDSNYLGMEKE
jgi:hypothetical protein